jgi:hypothetical protein
MSLDSGDTLKTLRLVAAADRPHPLSTAFCFEKESWSC